MRSENYVSLWIGTASSREELNNIVGLRFSDDGDYVPSQLMKVFEIPSYDEDLLEFSVFEQASRRLAVLLNGCSFDTTIIKQFGHLIGTELDFDATAVVLLYDFNADVALRATLQIEKVRLQFLGATQYK